MGRPITKQEDENRDADWDWDVLQKEHVFDSHIEHLENSCQIMNFVQSCESNLRKCAPPLKMAEPSLH